MNETKTNEEIGEKQRGRKRDAMRIIEACNSRERNEKREREGKREKERERRGIVGEDITIRNMITRRMDAYLHLRPPRGFSGAVQG